MTTEHAGKTREALQEEYNRVHARMGHMANPVNIAAANRTLDRIARQMAALEAAHSREGPAERTRRAVYATGNKWAIENFNETH